MQKFGQTLITNAGKSMLTAVDGAQGRIIYTKAILSTQDISTLGDDKVRALTALSDDKLDTAINVITVQTDTVTVGASFNNATVTQDILFKSIGWYAKTTVDNVEHLLAVTPSLTEQTLIASTNGASSASVDIELAMARGHNTTVTVNPIAIGLINNTQLQSAVNASHDDLATKIATKADESDIVAAKGDISTLKQTAAQNSSDIANAKGDISTLKQNVQSIPRYAENVVLNSYVPMATYKGNNIFPVQLSVGPRLDGKKVTIQLTYHVTRYNSNGNGNGNGNASGGGNGNGGINNVELKAPYYTNNWHTLLNDGNTDGFNITQTGTFTLANTIIWPNARTDGTAPKNSVILSLYNSDFDAEFWLKIAVWRDVNTPPDMTWLPAVADQYAMNAQLQALQAKVDAMSR